VIPADARPAVTRPPRRVPHMESRNLLALHRASACGCPRIRDRGRLDCLVGVRRLGASDPASLVRPGRYPTQSVASAWRKAAPRRGPKPKRARLVNSRRGKSGRFPLLAQGCRLAAAPKVVSYLGHSGCDANAVAEAAFDPNRTFFSARKHAIRVSLPFSQRIS
jgi:hypothetical protein